MRKLLLLLILVIPFFLYGQDNNFKPDISVSGIVIQDSVSLKSKVPNIMNLIDHHGPGAVVYLLNKNESECLKLSFHSGSNSFEVAEFHIIPTDKLNVTETKSAKLNIDNFTTESKISLFMSRAELVKLKGNSFIEEKKENVEILKYQIDNFELSSFLQEYNYPIYYANYSFENGKLIKIDFGFEYP